MAEEPNASLFSKLLHLQAEGICMWFPNQDGSVGDCGYIHKGSFVKLFNVFEPPNDLPSIPFPDTQPVPEERSNSDVVWRSVSSTDCSLELAVPVDPIMSSLTLNFSLGESSGAAAFFVPGGDTRTVDEYLEKDRFEEYLGRYYGRIVAKWPYHDLSRLMILQGVTRTRGWCRGLARATGRLISGSLEINLAGIPTLEVGLTRRSSVSYPWLVQAGPVVRPAAGSAAVPLGTTPENTVVISPVYISLRKKLKHAASRIISVPARAPTSSTTRGSGPFANPSSGQRVIVPAGEVTEGDSQPVGSDSTPNGYCLATSSEDIPTSPTSEVTNCSESEAQSDSSSDIDTTRSEPDNIKQFLDEVLAHDSSLEAAVISWDMDTVKVIDLAVNKFGGMQAAFHNIAFSTAPHSYSSNVVTVRSVSLRRSNIEADATAHPMPVDSIFKELHPDSPRLLPKEAATGGDSSFATDIHGAQDANVQEQSKNPDPRPLTTHPQTLPSKLKSIFIQPRSSPPSPAALANIPMSNVMSTSPQAFEAILFPTNGVPRFVQLTTSARLLIDPLSGQTKTTLVPMPELYLPASPNGWRSQRFDALYGMTVKLPQTYVVYHTPHTPIINTTIEQMQGKHYRAEMSWRGDVLVAKFLRRGGSSETLEIVDCEVGDYALVKNYLSTYCPAS